MLNHLSSLSPLSRSRSFSPTSPKSSEMSLFHAISSCNWQEVGNLLESKVGLDYRKSDGSTVLHGAIQRRAPRNVIEKLLFLGVDPNTPDKGTMNTPLFYAVKVNSSPDILSLLIENGGDVNKESHAKITPLAVAADQNVNPELIKILIDAGANVNHRDSRNWTPLFWAIRANVSPDLLQILIENGALCQVKDNFEKTPLMYGLELSTSLNLIRLLLANGAVIDNTHIKFLESKGNNRLARQLRKVRLMVILCTPRVIGKRSRSSLRLLPSELIRTVSNFLFTKN